jgi:hypothetical protein
MENYDSSDFPQKIDLGSKPDKCDMLMSASDANDCEPKIYYPSLYLPDAKGLEELPEDGWALIRFHRNSLNVNTRDKTTKVSTELEIREICLPESEGDGDDLATALQKIVKKPKPDEDDD